MSKRLERSTSSRDLSKSQFLAPPKKRCQVTTATIDDTVQELGRRLDSFLDTLEGLLQLITQGASDDDLPVDMAEGPQPG